MAIDLTNSYSIFDDLKEHIGHRIRCVEYGEDGESVAIECWTCNQILLSGGKDEDANEDLH